MPSLIYSPVSQPRYNDGQPILIPVCSQVFLLLVTEMSMFMLLIVPLPYTWRRKLFAFISDSPLVAKLQYGMKVNLTALRTEEYPLINHRSPSYSY